jgi:hypothetical protein
MGELDVDSDQHSSEPWFVPQIYIKSGVAFRVAGCCPWQKMTTAIAFHLSTCEQPRFNAIFHETVYACPGGVTNHVESAASDEKSHTSVP